jgi:hypothetical protein
LHHPTHEHVNRALQYRIARSGRLPRRTGRHPSRRSDRIMFGFRSALTLKPNCRSAATCVSSSTHARSATGDALVVLGHPSGPSRSARGWVT